MQMAPYRESFSRLLVGRELSGGAYYLLSYGSLAAFYAIAMNSGSIWVPIQFVGATAGALIAFIFPALVALKAAALSEGEPLAAVSARCRCCGVSICQLTYALRQHICAWGCAQS